MKYFNILLFLLLFSFPAFPQEIDYSKIKLVDEVFLAMEYVQYVSKKMRIYHSRPRRDRPYDKMMDRARRRLVILVNHYKIRYGDTFDRDWKYDDWLKTIPRY